MPITFESEDGDVAVFRVSGRLKEAELDRAQHQCEAMIKKVGDIKFLVLIEHFAGWDKAEGWEDMSFADRNDPYIKKMAIVGDAKWRDLAFMFTVRPVPIEYFEPDQEATAREWPDSS